MSSASTVTPRLHLVRTAPPRMRYVPLPKPPKSLSFCARVFWKRHIRELVESGVLNDDNVDEFAAVCALRGEVDDNRRRRKPYRAISSKLRKAAAAFGLTGLE